MDVLEYILQIVPAIAGGFQVTLSLFFIVIILSVPGGLLLALLRLSTNRVVTTIVDAYVYVLLIYYGLPFMIDGFELTDMTAAVLSFVLNYIAYLCEIFRSGIQSIPKGQYEGAKVLGFTYVQTMYKIILPQVIKRVLPPLANETITLLKDTSLVYVLAMNDILRITRSIVQRDFDITAFIVAGVFYLAMTFVLTKLYQYLERRMAIYED